MRRHGHSAAPASQRAIFWALVAFLCCCFTFGGASRVDVPSTIIVRAAAILLIATTLILGRYDRDAIRVPGLILVVAATVTAMQLVPLPPSLWSMLPGRELVVQVDQATGLQSWRPLSLTPDLTLNTLMALLPPAAAVLAFGCLSYEDRFLLLPAILIGVAASAVIGLVQITSHDLYFYRITNAGYPVGIFANRNHQAALVAMALPMLGVFARKPGTSERMARLRTGLAATAGIALLPFILANGSRAGLGLAIVGLAAGAALYFFRDRNSTLRISKLGVAATASTVLVALALVVGAALYSRNDAITRISSAQMGADERFRFIPEMSRMAADFFPVGSGFGSFDSVFRSYEPSEALEHTYFNHAHNDALELAIESGAFGFLVLTAFLGWWASRTAHYWRDLPRDGRARRFGRLGSVMIGMLFAASLVDYPLRTPILSTLFFIAACWMAGEPSMRDAKRLTGREENRDTG